MHIKVTGIEIKYDGRQYVYKEQEPESFLSFAVAFEVEFLQNDAYQYPYKYGTVPEPSAGSRHNVLACHEDYGYQEEVEEDG